MLRPLAALLLAIPVLGGCGASGTDADPGLWVVKDADTTIYLFGTVHMLKPGLSWFDEGVKDAFDKSDAVMLEVVMPDASEMNALVAELGVAQSGPTLPEQLTAEEAERLRAALTGLGMPADALDQSEPWLAATMLASLPLQKLGYDSKHGAEAVLTEAARKAGKPVAGLETAREQLGYFDTLPLPAQKALLAQTIKGLPDAGKMLEQALAAWKAGDADKLAALINDDVAASPELAEALLYKRNQRWADWIARRMEQPGTLFVAVGAGHLAGNGDVQSELAKRGLKVERVAY
ncbi:TraB/GumN family protein [Sphingomonas soli]|uniref:TraB/GumN family protein n=1 Tax=Sphingomonas soli TaxID=266127 RepID=UPI00082C0967|nr:TraB/GumN family protein [Sphingomonas soli]